MKLQHNLKTNNKHVKMVEKTNVSKKVKINYIKEREYSRYVKENSIRQVDVSKRKMKNKRNRSKKALPY